MTKDFLITPRWWKTAVTAHELAFLQRMSGYCLTGDPMSTQILFIVFMVAAIPLALYFDGLRAYVEIRTAWAIFKARDWLGIMSYRIRWHLLVRRAVARMNAAATEAEALAIRDATNELIRRMILDHDATMERYWHINRERVARAFRRIGL